MLILLCLFQLFKNVFNPDIGQSLAFIGFVQPASGGVLSMSETQARWYAELIKGHINLPSKSTMLDSIKLEEVTIDYLIVISFIVLSYLVILGDFLHLNVKHSFNFLIICFHSRRTTSMVSVFSLSVVDHMFEFQLDKTQDNESGIYCFSVNHAVIKSQDNVSEWSDMSIHELLFQ
jgi:hypothetical protein